MILVLAPIYLKDINIDAGIACSRVSCEHKIPTRWRLCSLCLAPTLEHRYEIIRVLQASGLLSVTTNVNVVTDGVLQTVRIAHRNTEQLSDWETE